jgi:hypothetical protein
MARPKKWTALSSFELSLNKTFLGKDAREAHTFRLMETLNDEYISFFKLNKDNLETEIQLLIEGRLYPAKLRWSRGNRTMTRIHKPGALRARDGLYFLWSRSDMEITQRKMADIFHHELTALNAGDPLSKRRIRFHHLKDNVFMMLTDHDREFLS